MFNTVLIANRGEIACRVIRTLRRMGVRSVAVYSEADQDARHVSEADEAALLGPAAAEASYLNVPAILEAARRTGARAVHPGYGFLSENAAFADACESAGLRFIGPAPEQIRDFGLKHTARAIAKARGVPLLPGTGLLDSAADAVRQAEAIGYPVILKATAGGGGIGMRVCDDARRLAEAFEVVRHLGEANFKAAGVYLERFVRDARHIEVQVFGDGHGRVLALGDRDCSSQRRNQKVIEETPAPGLDDATRAALHDAAVRLAQAVSYRSAGTVEFVLDVNRHEFHFLEVNTRLQVEHTVTEEVTGIDLVEWMVRVAAGDTKMFDAPPPPPRGHSIQVRLYAEDPAKDFQPSSGLLTHVAFPAGPRVDGWVESGTVVTPHYDPLLAKLIVKGPTRTDAIAALGAALGATRLDGIETNLGYLRQVVASPRFAEGKMTTRALGEFAYRPATVDVLSGGNFTTVQDFPGRVGYWDVGVPPSGPMDALSFRLGNRVLGNDEGEAGLECTVTGPALRFNRDAVVCLAGAVMKATLDGKPVPHWAPVAVAAGQVLKLGAVEGPGCRTYVLVRGGLDVPAYLGSKATFTLGQFGGHGGRTLRTGDVLHLGDELAGLGLRTPPSQGGAGEGRANFHPSPTLPQPLPGSVGPLSPSLVPALAKEWRIGVLDGPHGCPDFFLAEDIAMLFATAWEVHHNSVRTGVRLIGPKPRWARPDGGEAGLHPSNIHDNAYAVGTIDFTGDMPILLGPDGPSLGGFVCPATVVHAELWKMGQLAPGDRVRFVRLSGAEAEAMERAQDESVRTLRPAAVAPPTVAVRGATAPAASPVYILRELPEDPGSGPPPSQGGVGGGSDADEKQDTRDSVSQPVRGSNPPPAPPWKGGGRERPRVVYRRSGDKHLLVEYGPIVLDLGLRFRAHALMQWVERARDSGRLPGIVDLTPGIRSLQVHYDSRILPLERLLDALTAAEAELPAVEDMEVDSRIVHMPLSWEDPATLLAIDRYIKAVRGDAPWCPSNIEFIRRINGLASVDEVRRIVFDASYLVLGLGDVYLGAPVATPLDPRHRLVTTKYNPARTWTPENAVGIGGAYLCVYGMEGPGGYQFVGRTAQVWNSHRQTADFTGGRPWLLRFFDQIRFHPVSHEEILRFRRDFPHGRVSLKTEPTRFRLRDYFGWLRSIEPEARDFKRRQQAAFDAERAEWARRGEFERAAQAEAPVAAEAPPMPAGLEAVESPMGASVWKVLVKEGDRVKAGDEVAVLEAMKMETAVTAPRAVRVVKLLCKAGQVVQAGQPLMWVE